MEYDLVGQTLGKYRLIRSVGAGGMGAVYEARHETLDQKAAVKVLQPELAKYEDAVKRFLQEGRFVAKLRHDGIAAVYDLGEERGIHYLAMEFAEGRPLTRLIDDKGPLRPVRALAIAHQVADALAAAHAQAVVHRDIKPDNIMVSRSGKVKVMDFGIAKDLGNDAEMTIAGTQIGTLLYMSPEQCRGGAIDHRTDLFSLGVVLFQMLTGRLPYATTLSHLDLVTKIQQGEFPSPRYVNPEITEAVEQLVLKLTAANVDDRYDSAPDVSDDIRHLIRMKAYEPPREAGDDGGVVRKSLRRLMAGGAPESAPKQRDRAAVGRRREDRQLAAEIGVLRQKVQQSYADRRRLRHAVRRHCRALLHGVQPVESNGTPQTARLLDLSEGGAALFVEQALVHGSRHLIEIEWDEGVVRSPAIVAWTRFIEKRSGFATGFEFVETSQSDRNRLVRLLESVSESAGL